MSGLNPQGVQVYSFKQPSEEDLEHDFMWRHVKCLPQRGRIGIFNRSYYEEVLIVRVHPDLLKAERLPAPCRSRHIWRERLAQIGNFEEYLTAQGTINLKFFLNVFREEQKKRILDRLEKPQKHWKFAMSDARERHYWSAYMHAYEKAIKAAASERAPWFVVPADNKWFTRLVVAAAVVEAVEELHLTYPRASPQQMKELRAIRAMLVRER